MILYIDTHLNKIDLALMKDDKVIDRVTKDNVIHTEETICSLEQLLKKNHLEVESINEIIVINGPGSFTGVRIGVVIAKVMAYSLKIKVKAISYLQALALSYHQEVKTAIEDRNGAFIGEFDCNHQLIHDYYYLKNSEWKLLNKEDYVTNEEIDLKLIVEFLKDQESTDPHLLKPLYVKKIEVQK